MKKYNFDFYNQKEAEDEKPVFMMRMKIEVPIGVDRYDLGIQLAEKLGFTFCEESEDAKLV